MNTKRFALIGLLACGGSLPFLSGADGGCGSFTSTTPAPDVTGKWTIAYGTTMTVTVNIGGAVYSQSLPAGGGAFTVTHQGKPYSFNLDCSRPEVVCPSEVWPTMVSIDQRDTMYKHRMWVKIPVQQCNGVTTPPPANQCGMGTTNPECKPVCSGSITTSSADAFGLISESGDKFDLLLGGSFATNGVNCALLGISSASASLVSAGQGIDWQATEMRAGAVKTGFAGGCLWAGALDPLTGKPEALVLGASVEIATPFTGKRQ
jgi:hypothetical protein